MDYKNYFNKPLASVSDVITKILSPIFGEFQTNLIDENADYVNSFGNGGANIEHIYDYGSFMVQGKVSVWEVVLADNCHISYARKNIQATIRKITENYTGAFIVFHYAKGSTNPEAHTWRLSWLMRTDSQVRTSTPKRYTYLCGPAYSCRTIAERFEKLQNDPRKTLDTITKAFDVETLSEEFFKEYKVMYDDIIQWITGQRIIKKDGKWKEAGALHTGAGDDVYQRFYNRFGPDEGVVTKAIRDYVKKLLGRLVFIQFLQKKGWLKIDGVASSNFLLDLFNNVSENCQDDFIEKVLEKVVYLLLNNENRLPGSDKIDNLVLDVPFLNGGLFEPDACDDIIVQLPKEFFHNETYKDEKRIQNETKLRDNDKFFNQCGILDLFNQYNFTIDENDPDDAEVGVDPEMLGKIFENLLEDNKDKGAFYTPKEIVNYMCKESLIAYLNTEVPGHDSELRDFIEKYENKVVPEKDLVLKALKGVKICDPAVGSGAFPMCILNFLVALREKLEPVKNRCDLKKEIVQNNIYGVDIEKGAIDIARLRFWLSIMVDEDKPTPLPNFDYKFMQGNSLLTTFDLQYVDIKQAKENTRVTAEFNKRKAELLKKKNEFYLLSGEAKYKKEVEIKLLIVEILKLRLGFEKVSVEQQDITRQMELFAAPEMPQNNRSQKKIQEVRVAQERVKRMIEKLLEIEKQLKDESKTWEQRAKTDILFFDWEICFAEIFPQDEPESEKGFDIVIGNPPYINISNLKPDDYREKLKSAYTCYKNKSDLYAFFIEMSFSLLDRSGILTFIVPHTWKATDSFIKLRELLFVQHSVDHIVNLSNRVFKAIVTPMIIMARKSHCDNYDIFIKNDEFTIINKVPFSEIIQDDSYVFDTISGFEQKRLFTVIEQRGKPLNTYLKFSRGIKTSNDKRFVIQQKKDSDCYKVFRGGNIKRYELNWNGEFVWYRPDLMREKVGAVPHTKSFFEAPEKIVIQRVNSSMQLLATYDNNKNYFLDTVNVSDYSKWDKKTSYKYICALLNSSVINFWYCNKYRMPTIGGYELHSIPIISVNTHLQSLIVDLVDKILEAKNAKQNTATHVWERKIDIIVYLLYGLTYDEVMVVENASQGEKFKLDQATYDKWLAHYTKDGALPSEEEMEKELYKIVNNKN